MIELWHILAVFALGAVPSALLCRVVITLRIVDAPTEPRKLQKAPVPTAGGLAVALSAVLAFATYAEVSRFGYDPALVVAGVGSIAVLAVGLTDDILKLRAIAKLALIALVAVGMTALGLRTDVMEFWPGASLELPLMIAIAGSVLWLIVVINAVNFMDGANGLSMGMACVAAIGLAACGAVTGTWHISLAAAALAGGLAGFLVWNVQGLLYVGDAGALFTGALLSGLGLELVRLRPDLLFVPAILLLPFLSDVLLTLAWRREILVRAGDLNRFNGRLDVARKLFDQVIAADTARGRADWMVLYARATVRNEAADWAGAEEDLKAAMAIEPDRPELLNYLGYGWIKQGKRIEEGLALITRAAESRPDQGYIVDSLGWAHYQLGHYDVAIEHLERAAELSPIEPEILDHLGDAYWRAGRQDEARFEWLAALELKPETAREITLREKLEKGLPAMPGARLASRP